MSLFWFSLLQDILPNHLITADIDKMPSVVQQYKDQLEGRTMLVKKLTILPIESIVRGYITGSAWKEYVKQGTVCGMTIQAGLQDCDAFPRPLFTPSTKAEIGDHGKHGFSVPFRFKPTVSRRKYSSFKRYRALVCSSNLAE